MAARARSTVRALNVFGNSVRGLDFANWRRTFHAIILPVLTYGLPLWSHRPPKSLLHILQVAQNDAVRKLSGTFKTTPIEPLHNMVAIPPIKYLVPKLRLQATNRISRLPHSHRLLTLTSNDPTRFHPPFITVPTPLTTLLPASLPPFFLPSHRMWSHPQVTSSLTCPQDDKLLSAVQARACQSTLNSTSVFIYPIPHLRSQAVAFLISQDDTIIDQGFHVDHSSLTAQVHATVLATQALARLPKRNTTFFLPSRNLHNPLLSLHKHPHLPSASLFTSCLSAFLHLHPDIFFTLLHLPTRLPKPPPNGHIPDPRTFPCDWPGPPRKDHVLDNLRIQAGHTDLPPPPETPKLLAFRLWREDYERNPTPCKWTPNHVVPIPTTPEPPPFMLGTLSLKQQQASSIALQVFFKHCFARDYSRRFRPQAGDNTTCECSFPLQDHTRPVGGQSDVEPHPPETTDQDPGFTRLMREFLDPNTPRSRSNSPPPYQPLRAGARRRHQPHSAHHAIFSCPRATRLQRDLLGHNPNPHTLFHTFKGAVSLVTFLFASNSLLRPLPPRPDPP